MHILINLITSRCQYASRAKLLLQHDADVMISNNKKELPLHRASCKDHNIEVYTERNMANEFIYKLVIHVMLALYTDGSVSR